MSFGPASRNLNQQITYWANTGAQNAFGVNTYAAPELIFGRWSDEAVEVSKPDGEQIISRSVVHVDRAVTVRGYLALGDKTDDINPLGLEGAYEIQAVGAVPDIRFMEQQKKAYL